MDQFNLFNQESFGVETNGGEIALELSYQNLNIPRYIW